jgi:large subunit ribosomal protein L25
VFCPGRLVCRLFARTGSSAGRLDRFTARTAAARHPPHRQTRSAALIRLEYPTVSEVRIPAEPRNEFGKGAARRVRRAHKVPAVLYGHGAEPQHYSLPGHDLMMALKQGSNVLLRLEIGAGESELVLPRGVQRDPIKGHLEHVDLLVVRRGEQVDVEIPVTVTGVPAAGTIVDLQHPTLTVSAEATEIPTEIVVDVAGLDEGVSIIASNVTLPEGVTLVSDPTAVVVQILSTRAARAEETEEDEAPVA